MGFEKTASCCGYGPLFEPSLGFCCCLLRNVCIFVLRDFFPTVAFFCFRRTIMIELRCRPRSDARFSLHKPNKRDFPERRSTLLAFPLFWFQISAFVFFFVFSSLGQTGKHKKKLGLTTE